MIIKNAYVYGIGHQFRQADLCMEGERIADRAAVDGEETFDAEGLYALPGLLDLHFHGAVGCDLCDADAEGLRKIAEFEAQHGVLAICPATVTSPEDLLTDVMKMVASYRNGEGADVVGVNMEGPYLNLKKARKRTIAAARARGVPEAEVERMQSEWEASVRAETSNTQGSNSPAILYMLGIISSRPCDAVNVVVRAPA